MSKPVRQIRATRRFAALAALALFVPALLVFGVAGPAGAQDDKPTISITALDFDAGMVEITNHGDAEVDINGIILCNFPAYGPIEGADPLGPDQSVMVDAGAANVAIDPAGGDVTIEPTGAVIQAGAEIGRIRVVDFAREDLHRLEKAGETFFTAPADAVPALATNTMIHQNHLEMPAFGMKATVKMLMASKSFDAISRSRRNFTTSRWLWTPPFLALVMSFSATGRMALALASVVTMPSAAISEATRLAIMAFWCAELPPKRRPLRGRAGMRVSPSSSTRGRARRAWR